MFRRRLYLLRLPRQRAVSTVMTCSVLCLPKRRKPSHTGRWPSRSGTEPAAVQHGEERARTPHVGHERARGSFRIVEPAAT